PRTGHPSFRSLPARRGWRASLSASQGSSAALRSNDLSKRAVFDEYPRLAGRDITRYARVASQVFKGLIVTYRRSAPGTELAFHPILRPITGARHDVRHRLTGR